MKYATAGLALVFVLTFAAVLWRAQRPAPASANHQRIETTIAGRMFVVESDQDAEFHPGKRKDAVSICFADGHEIVIQDNRIIVDRAKETRLAPGVRRVEMKYVAGNLNVIAKGADEDP